jgi:hypothetical protein
MASVVLHTDTEPHASATQCVVRPSWTAGRYERDGGSRITEPELAVFAGAKRAQLQALGEAAVTAGLHEVVSGETYLASLRPQASLRLVTTPIVLAARRGSSSEGADEGGIYSW